MYMYNVCICRKIAVKIYICPPKRVVKGLIKNKIIIALENACYLPINSQRIWLQMQSFQWPCNCYEQAKDENMLEIKNEIDCIKK